MSKRTQSPEPDFAKTWRNYRRWVRIGQAIMIIGVLVVVSHWLAHLEVFGPGQPPGWLDFVAGYPTGALLLMTGAILAGRSRPKPGAHA